MEVATNPKYGATVDYDEGVRFVGQIGNTGAPCSQDFSYNL
jgi:hypothetical protein